MRDFRKYTIWQDAIVIANQIYEVTSNFPQKELYSLSNQLERAAVSIASNIAEGASRTSPNEYAHYIEIAIGSAFEVETQLTIALQREYLPTQKYDELISQLQSIERRANTLINKLKQTVNNHSQNT